MMEAFAKNQHEMREKIENADVMGPFTQFSDAYKQVWENQQDMFSKSMEIFTKFNPMMSNQDEDKK